MDEKDNRQPIEQRHIDFMREVTAVARKHGVRSVKVEYYGGEWGQPWTRVTGQWSSGRHGSDSNISLRAEAIHHCAEKDADHG